MSVPETYPCALSRRQDVYITFIYIYIYILYTYIYIRAGIIGCLWVPQFRQNKKNQNMSTRGFFGVTPYTSTLNVYLLKNTSKSCHTSPHCPSLHSSKVGLRPSSESTFHWMVGGKNTFKLTCLRFPSEIAQKINLQPTPVSSLPCLFVQLIQKVTILRLHQLMKRLSRPTFFGGFQQAKEKSVKEA